MIREFTDRIRDREAEIKAKIRDAEVEISAEGLFRAVIEELAPLGENNYSWDVPDPERITVIDHGDYQGTLLFVVGAQGYQPSNYWAVSWGYGSCSGCDSIQALLDYSSETEYLDPEPGERFGKVRYHLSEQGVNDAFSMMMHMVEGLVQV